MDRSSQRRPRLDLIGSFNRAIQLYQFSRRGDRAVASCKGNDMKTYILLGLATAMMLLYTTASHAGEPTAAGRLGIYNSRAVALAWGRSTQHNTAVRELHAQAQRATAAGDKKELARLKKEGASRQEVLEKQVFGDARIPNVIAILEPRLPQIAAKAGVTNIVDGRDAPKGAAVVDVTSALVSEFHPTEQTLNMIEQTLKHKPLKRIPKH